MYTVEFYEKENGKSELWDFLEKLRQKSETSKDARIQYKQIGLYIQLLQEHGTQLSNDITKYIEEDTSIEELNPNTVFRGRASAILAKMLVNAQSIACAF